MKALKKYPCTWLLDRHAVKQTLSFNKWEAKISGELL